LGQTLLLTRTGQVRKNIGQAEHDAGQLLSPMPGQVRALQVTPGETISKGQTLVIVEAMKMEIKIIAPSDGRVKAVLVQVGQSVNKEQLLIEIEP
jgi:biotin carboxyl carrier protein